MKKQTLPLIFVVIATLLTCILSARAAQRQPPFFIPQKVLNKMNQPEKLPPIQQINYQNRQTSTTNEAEQKANLERQQQEKAAEAKRLAEQQKIAEQRAQEERLKQEELEKKQRMEEELKRIQKAEAEQRAKIERLKQEELGKALSPEEESVQMLSENKGTPNKERDSTSSGIIATPPTQAGEPKPNSEVSAGAKAQVKPQETPQIAPLNNSQRTFDDIISDYKRDARGISQGKPVNNPRLLDILQDYSDERHVL